ncbi:MAG TPA: sugar-binding protein, partial [Prolixibacteraceae bacterium]|nr:sugar-binding protein [Prolixibacteraceae bacterium]
MYKTKLSYNMKNLLRLLLLVFSLFHFSLVLDAQKVNVDIKKTLTPPVIDAQTDMIWDAVEPVYLEKNMTRDIETPTVTAFWKALYDDEYIYLLINVEDDEHLPSWKTGGNHWEYDKPEVYFDVNNILNDGLGTSTIGTGHYQYAPPFEELNYSIPHFINYMNLEVFWCYELDGSNYQVEYAFPYALMPQGDGTTLDVNGFKNLPENIGFDVTVIDRDQGDQYRKRKVWQHNGIIVDEAWNSMDECGTIKLVDDIAANKNNAFVQKTTLAPQIDGQVDALWNDIDTNKIEKDFINESPTVDAFWKATWADSGLFVLVSVDDDNHWPSWKSGGDLWRYDWVNVFFDVNQDLKDGGGTGAGLGHLETYFNIEELNYGIPYLNVIPSLSTTGGNYAYRLNGDIFTLEMFIPFENFTDNTGTTMTKQSMLSRAAIGFDVNITDQDEGITSSRHRKVWQNDGSGCGEAWACMDDCGTIILDGEPVIDISDQTIAFDEIYIGNTQNKSFTIGNLAYEPLSITSVTSNNENFIVSFSPKTLNRNKTTEINVTFSPSTPGNTEGQLTILSNAGDTTITVTGSAQNSPIEFELSPTSFDVSSFSCSDSVSQQLTINNTGTEDLQYTISATHQNSNAPGEVLETMNGFLNNPRGLVIANNLVYTIQWDQLYVYNIQTMSVLNTYQIHNDSWGLATDGQYLYIGQNGGIVYKYNFDGSLIGEFLSLPFSDRPSLAFNGEHLIIANSNLYNPTIYKCDLNGNIVSTYTSTFNGYLSNMAWNSKHADGQLWANDNNYGYIYQLRFEGNQLIRVNSFPHSTAWESAVAFYDNNLWFATNSTLYVMHDGVEDGWLSFDQVSGTIAPGENATVNVGFNAKKVNSNTYNASIIINSNDPVNPVLPVPTQFTLDGEAQMELSATAFDFGETFANGTKFDTLTISNPGCDTLFIDFTSSNENIFFADTTHYVLPGKSANVILSFSPDETMEYNESLELKSNLGQETITGTGTGTPAPEIALSAANFDVETTNCSDSISQTLTISNTGAANLEFNITTTHQNSNTPGEELETMNGFLNNPRGLVIAN